MEIYRVNTGNTGKYGPEIAPHLDILLISYNAGKTIIYLQYTASFQPWKNVDKHISAQVIYREISSLKKS